jgi:mono/diheme cytochrome c family protein
MSFARIVMAALTGLWLARAALAQSAPAAGQKPAAAPGARAVEFFESRVRPILVENCFACHGPKKQKNGLRLDSKASVLKGGDTGPVVVPGNSDASLLVRAVRYGGDTKMPPNGKLPAEAIDTLTEWVKMGAPWPEAHELQSVGLESTSAKKHWAFQPVRLPAVPNVKGREWAKTPVDHFVMARLEEKGMRPSPPADRHTLIRRVTFDLTGLPPTPEQVDAFVNDPAPDAFAKVVDRLLASPAYGERWGRHWLDVARYADTKGYVFQEERRYPYAYTYRDYVIRAFNEDLPYDQFILQQLAADQLPLGEDKRSLAAMGYLTLGRRFLNNVNDIIDDRIDVVCRGLLGLTVTCARCHDHKFDPIPTRDYYSLYGVFASSVEPRDLPLVGAPERTPEYVAFEKELQARERKAAEFLQAKHTEAVQRFRSQAADYLLATGNTNRRPGEEPYQALNLGDLNRFMIARWQAYLAERAKRHDPVFAPWLAYVQLSQKDFAANAAKLTEQFIAGGDPTKKVNPLIAKALAGGLASLRDVAERYAKVFAEVDRHWQEALRKAKESGAAEPRTLAEPAEEAVRNVLYGADAPPNVPAAEVRRFLDRKSRDQLTALQRKVDELRATSAVAPARAMVLVDAPSPVTPHVLLRGNPNTPGDEVPRQFLRVLAGEHRRPFAHGSGRVDLARSIASPDNPLTARVVVNRVWLQYFGAGLVRTPSDFGTRGEPPTHPQLLDYLARTFMDSGWSLKKLHRAILLSATYQQSGDVNPRYAQLDPDNRLLWHVPRRRLDFEAMRDSLLAVAGRLDAKPGGRAVDLTTQPFSTRRSVYGFIDRQNLPGVFRSFDFASPDTTSPQRHATTVPQQALFLMNSPFVVEQARRLVARPEVARCHEPELRIEHLYRIAYGRGPTPEETSLGARFVGLAEEEARQSSPANGLSPWEKYAQVLLLANEFVYVD